VADNTPFRPVDPAKLGIPSPHVEIDTTIAHPARVYDYVLGGKDNYPADREVAEKAMAALPTAREETLANREFLRRAVRYVVRDEGIDQILDIGTGIPTVGPTHEVAEEANPAVKVVYVDNDPIVLVHARALLVDDERTTVMQADVRDPATILARAEEFLDLSRPIAIMFVGLWYFIPEEDDPDALLAQYRAALAPGSYMLLTHALDTPEVMEVKKVYKTSSQLAPRSRSRIAELFTGWDLVPPGLKPIHEWRPDGDETHAGHMLGGVGRLTR
jgi:O-methyltransferase involved in polyketide biosynthesis